MLCTCCETAAFYCFKAIAIRPVTSQTPRFFSPLLFQDPLPQASQTQDRRDMDRVYVNTVKDLQDLSKRLRAWADSLE